MKFLKGKTERVMVRDARSAWGRRLAIAFARATIASPHNHEEPSS